jgi:hypothetical protein
MKYQPAIYFILALFGGSLLMSCESQGRLRLPEHESKLVVNAIWYPGYPVWVHVSRSFSSYETINPNELIIHDAEVELWKDGVSLGILSYVDTLVQEPEPYISPPRYITVRYGQYERPDIPAVEEGSIYQISVRHPEWDDVLAETYIPKPVPIDTVSITLDAVNELDFTGFTTTYHIIDSEFDDPADEENYYLT